MTREEAIEMCQSLKFVIFIADDEDYTDMIEEALDMAIEALRKEEKE